MKVHQNGYIDNTPIQLTWIMNILHVTGYSKSATPFQYVSRDLRNLMPSPNFKSGLEET